MTLQQKKNRLFAKALKEFDDYKKELQSTGLHITDYDEYIKLVRQKAEELDL